MKNQHDVGVNNFLLIRTSFGVERRRESEDAGRAGAWLERILDVAQVLNHKTGCQSFFLNL